MVAATDTPPSRQSKRPSARNRKPKGARNTKTVRRNKPPANAKRGSKKSKILALLKRPGGASLQQLQKATGWQAHSVRGFLSGALKKTMGLQVDSVQQSDGSRFYVVTEK
jgi:hypothetical protein